MRDIGSIFQELKMLEREAEVYRQSMSMGFFVLFGRLGNQAAVRDFEQGIPKAKETIAQLTEIKMDLEKLSPQVQATDLYKECIILRNFLHQIYLGILQSYPEWKAEKARQEQGVGSDYEDSDEEEECKYTR